MKHILLLLAAVLFPVLILVSCDKNDEDYDWDLIASGVNCYSGAADSELVDMNSTMTVDVYQHVTNFRYFTGKSTSSPIISENTYNFNPKAKENEKSFYRYSFTDGSKTWYLNF